MNPAVQGAPAGEVPPITFRRVATLAYMRTYDLPAEVHLASDPLPDWFLEHVQRPYVLSRSPGTPMYATVDTVVLGQELKMVQMALLFPHLRLVQMLFWIEDLDLQARISDGLVPFPLEVRWSEDDAPCPTSGEHTAADVLDRMYTQLTGQMVDDLGPRRTDLGALVFCGPGTPTPDLRSLGSFMGCEVKGAAYDLQVVGASACSPDVFSRVVVVASVLGRSRHIRKRLIESISDTADSVLNDAADPWKGVRSTSQIQAENILFRREMNGEGFLNRAATKELLRNISPALQVPHDHLDDLASATESLDSLSQSLFGLAIEDAQRRFGWYGVFFAALSILFATFATVDLVETQMASRVWVCAALLSTAALWTLVHRVMRSRAVRS